jgi:hypothetical protein
VLPHVKLKHFRHLMGLCSTWGGVLANRFRSKSPR